MSSFSPNKLFNFPNFLSNSDSFFSSISGNYEFIFILSLLLAVFIMFIVFISRITGSIKSPKATEKLT